MNTKIKEEIDAVLIFFYYYFFWQNITQSIVSNIEKFAIQQTI